MTRAASFSKLNLRRRIAAVVLSVAAIALAAGCGSSAGTHAAANPSGPTSDTIVIKNFAFEPSTLRVAPGARVTVRNEDSATHTVTAIDPHGGAFDTHDVNPGATASFVAPSAPGSYPYICQIHQFMHATLTVG